MKSKSVFLVTLYIVQYQVFIQFLGSYEQLYNKESLNFKEFSINENSKVFLIQTFTQNKGKFKVRVVPTNLKTKNKKQQQFFLINKRDNDTFLIS